MIPCTGSFRGQVSGSELLHINFCWDAFRIDFEERVERDDAALGERAGAVSPYRKEGKSMRVIAGSARSLPLKTPPGTDTRPTTDRIKETLFNILQSEVPQSICMDLFSGSGGIGIEALSRGAAYCYFVENQAKAFSCIEENVCFTGFKDRSALLRQDVLSALMTVREQEVDLIFMDPPYQGGYEEKVLEILSDREYVTERTWIIAEADINKDFSFAEKLGFRICKEKRYKTNKHVFLERKVSRT